MWRIRLHESEIFKSVGVAFKLRRGWVTIKGKNRDAFGYAGIQ